MILLERPGAAVLACLLLAACNPQQQEQEQSAPQAAAAPAAAAGQTVFDDMTGTMERARAVQELTQQHKQALDEAMDEAERGDP